MIVYKIDKQARAQCQTTGIREMDAVLREMAQRYRFSIRIFEEQKDSISSPTINAYRAELVQRINTWVDAARLLKTHNAWLP